MKSRLRQKKACPHVKFGILNEKLYILDSLCCLCFAYKHSCSWAKFLVWPHGHAYACIIVYFSLFSVERKRNAHRKRDSCLSMEMNLTRMISETRRGTLWCWPNPPVSSPLSPVMEPPWAQPPRKDPPPWRKMFSPIQRMRILYSKKWDTVLEKDTVLVREIPIGDIKNIPIFAECDEGKGRLKTDGNHRKDIS